MREPSIIDSYLDCSVDTGKGWAIVKPIQWNCLRTRIYHAWLVFRGKATAVRFWEDTQ